MPNLRRASDMNGSALKSQGLFKTTSSRIVLTVPEDPIASIRPVLTNRRYEGKVEEEQECTGASQEIGGSVEDVEWLAGGDYVSSAPYLPPPEHSLSGLLTNPLWSVSLSQQHQRAFYF